MQCNSLRNLENSQVLFNLIELTLKVFQFNFRNCCVTGLEMCFVKQRDVNFSDIRNSHSIKAFRAQQYIIYILYIYIHSL